MVAVLTGDIVNSQKIPSKQWLPILKEALSQYGEETIDWEVYRGDSFQLETKIKTALETAIFIKASIKQFKELDVRIAIGLGLKDYDAGKVTQSSGSAFVYSGQCFDQLKKQVLAIKSDNIPFDDSINLMLRLALLTMNNWPPISANIIKTAILNADLNQSQLAKILNKAQSNISKSLNRSGFEEIKQLIDHYQNKVALL